MGFKKIFSRQEKDGNYGLVQQTGSDCGSLCSHNLTLFVIRQHTKTKHKYHILLNVMSSQNNKLGSAVAILDKILLTLMIN